MYGMYVGIDIFDESDLSVPVYSYRDPNVLATSGATEVRLFHWNGYTNTNMQAVPGRYTIRITLLDHNFEPTTWVEQERNAIIIAVAEVNIAATSDTYLSRH